MFSSAAAATADRVGSVHRPGLTADKITSARAIQFSFVEVAALIQQLTLSARPAGAFNDDISRVVYNAVHARVHTLQLGDPVS